MTDREELFNGICLLVPDEDTRNRLYIMLDKYEITARSTEIAVMHSWILWNRGKKDTRIYRKNSG